MWFGYETDESYRRGSAQRRARRHAQFLCVHECPAASFHGCALLALRLLEGCDELDGVWAGVELRGAELRKKPQAREAALQQLQHAAAYMPSRRGAA
jgi:hypothetical protein